MERKARGCGHDSPHARPWSSGGGRARERGGCCTPRTPLHLTTSQTSKNSLGLVGGLSVHHVHVTCAIIATPRAGPFTRLVTVLLGRSGHYQAPCLIDFQDLTSVAIRSPTYVAMSPSPSPCPVALRRRRPPTEPGPFRLGSSGHSSSPVHPGGFRAVTAIYSQALILFLFIGT